jgi:hypothetical protein
MCSGRVVVFLIDVDLILAGLTGKSRSIAVSSGLIVMAMAV